MSRKIYLSEGAFITGAPIEITKDNLALHGQGQLTTSISLASGSDCDVIRSTATRTGIHLADFSIAGNKANQSSGVGIRGTRWGQSLIERVKILNTKETAMYMTYPSSANAGLTIRNCHIYMPDNAAIVIDGHFQDVTVEHNYIDNPFQHAIAFNTAGGTCKNARVLYNDIFLHRSETQVVNLETISYPSTGIHFNNSTGTLDRLWVVGNTILRTQQQHTTDWISLFGIWIPLDATTKSLWATEKFIISNYVGSMVHGTQTSGDGISVNGDNVTMIGNLSRDVDIGDGYVIGGEGADGAYYWTLIGNRALNNGGLGFLIGGGGVSEGAQRWTISGNFASGNGRDGMLLYGSHYNSITGNVMRGNTESGLTFGAGTTESGNNSVVGNVSVGNTRYGIEEIDATNTNFYFNNQLEANTIAPMLIVGANSIARNNYPYLTEGSGTFSIANGATSAVITHGLSVTPALKNINITFGENPSNDPGNVWVDTIGATQFTVHCRNDPGASNLDGSWNVSLARG